MTLRRAAVAMALAIAAIASGAAAETKTEAPPANLVSGDAAHGAALDPVFAHFRLARLACTFSEEKHIALLAKPLRSSGTIYYDRDKGIARTTKAPKPEHVVVTRTTLRFRKGDRTEEIPLDKSKDLKAFALIFPTVLRGERGELERSFDIGLYGSDAAWWALAFTPKTDSLRAMVRRVVVFGHKAELVALQVVEASGDTTDTQLSELRTNGAVPDAEIASAFGAP
jgi:outer membrane lipoprotein-sorting protein